MVRKLTRGEAGGCVSHLGTLIAGGGLCFVYGWRDVLGPTGLRCPAIVWIIDHICRRSRLFATFVLRNLHPAAAVGQGHGLLPI